MSEGAKTRSTHLDSAYANGYNPFATGVHTIIADGIKGTDERAITVQDGEYVKKAKIGRSHYGRRYCNFAKPFQKARIDGSAAR